ncbi:MAG: glycosyltransferase [Candidatus Thermoplasmatota archaeon]|nr:glycosyltransferase [Candidatus Thermoplasmatota archaeon]
MDKVDTKVPRRPHEVVQLCHGRLIPSYSSGYSLRCNELTEGMDRIRVTLFGPSLSNNITADTYEYHANLMLLNAILHGNRSFEILLSRGKYLPLAYRKNISNLISKSRCVILEGPWHYRLVKDLIQDRPVIYDAHNFETGLRRENKYYEFVRELEKEVCESVNLIITVTQDDMNRIQEEYNVQSDKMRLLTHIPTVNECQWTGKNSKSLVFIGSLYEANIVAYREIEKIAEALPEFNFLVLGSICSLPGKKNLPNLKCLGVVPETQKDAIMIGSMLALNPIMLGSGRNVKMVDYLAHSLPIISTSIGVRGFNPITIQEACIIIEIGDFVKTIKELDRNRDLLQKMSIASRKRYLEIKKENAISFREIYDELMSGKQ